MHVNDADEKVLYRGHGGTEESTVDRCVNTAAETLVARDASSKVARDNSLSTDVEMLPSAIIARDTSVATEAPTRTVKAPREASPTRAREVSMSKRVLMLFSAVDARLTSVATEAWMMVA